MPVLQSTKNLEIIEPPTATREGVALFEYTDHYTVFHYGRMPDAIPGKGEAICRMAVFNFTLLEAAGIRTHFRRFLPPNRIEFSLARVPAVEERVPDEGNFLVPVQVLVRNELPQGSSVHHRLASGALTPSELGLSSLPAIGEKLQNPLIEYATMLEQVNRFVSESEIQRYTGLSGEWLHAMRETAVAVNEVLNGHAETVGISHSDGKVELLVSSDGRLVVADSPGTPDESRLLFDGVHCGKQVLRNWYVDNELDVPVSTLIANGVPRSRWPQPTPLPSEFLPVMSDLYRSLSQTWTGEQRWNTPDLKTATQTVAHLIGH